MVKPKKVELSRFALSRRIAGPQDCVEMAVTSDLSVPVVTFWLDRACSGLVRRPLCKIREQAGLGNGGPYCGGRRQ